jgi:phenylalanyl-tRNA synthetase alpha chain
MTHSHLSFYGGRAHYQIFFEGKWLEVLGCGVIHRDIMAACGLGTHYGYAFGLGLERLAMVLYG